jgi:hypothetical protein
LLPFYGRRIHNHYSSVVEEFKGGISMSDCKKHKIKDVNDYKHLTPDTSCTCEGAGGSDRGEGMGPATDPELVAKRK